MSPWLTAPSGSSRTRRRSSSCGPSARGPREKSSPQTRTDLDMCNFRIATVHPELAPMIRPTRLSRRVRVLCADPVLRRRPARRLGLRRRRRHDRPGPRRRDREGPAGPDKAGRQGPTPAAEEPAEPGPALLSVARRQRPDRPGRANQPRISRITTDKNEKNLFFIRGYPRNPRLETSGPGPRSAVRSARGSARRWRAGSGRAGRPCR